jgi:hypothetical protein
MGIVVAVTIAFVAGCIAWGIASPSLSSPSCLPYGFVDASAEIPNLLLDIRYYSNHNFMGRRVQGYNAPMCVLTEAAAQALALVSQDAAALGYGTQCFAPAALAALHSSGLFSLTRLQLRAESVRLLPTEASCCRFRSVGGLRPRCANERRVLPIAQQVPALSRLYRPPKRPQQGINHGSNIGKNPLSTHRLLHVFTTRRQVSLPVQPQATYTPGQPLQPCFDKLGVRFGDNR